VVTPVILTILFTSGTGLAHLALAVARPSFRREHVTCGAACLFCSAACATAAIGGVR
jgi:hypothetical protein